MKNILFRQNVEMAIKRAMSFLIIILFSSSPIWGEVYNYAGINYSYIPYSGVANVANGANGVAGSTVSGYVTIMSNLTINNREYVVKGIRQNAFLYNRDLLIITIPETIEEIGHDAFRGCSKLQYAYMYDGLTYIGDYCYISCGNLKDVDIPSTVTYIGKNAFGSCFSLEKIVIPDGVKSLSESVFNGCSKLQNVDLNKVETIGTYCFRGCQSLKHIALPDCLTTIGQSAFQSCGLNSITIPASVTSIGAAAFYLCNNLNIVTSLIVNPFEISDNVFSNAASAVLYVPKGCKEKYMTTGGWKNFGRIIELGGSDIETLSEPVEYNMGAIPDNVDMLGTAIDNTYYVLDSANGDGLDVDSGCVVINTLTTSEAIGNIAGKDISDESVKSSFKGLIFKVPSGSGSVSVTAETLGSSSLMVKIGGGETSGFQMPEQNTVVIPYSVDEASYVYIYAGTSTPPASKKNVKAAVASENSVKVYSFKWEPSSTTGIATIDASDISEQQHAGAPKGIYTLTGAKVSDDTTNLKTLPRGIYIVNGRKVAIK